jgi:hypothetical protein
MKPGPECLALAVWPLTDGGTKLEAEVNLVRKAKWIPETPQGGRPYSTFNRTALGSA